MAHQMMAIPSGTYLCQLTLHDKSYEGKGE